MGKKPVLQSSTIQKLLVVMLGRTPATVLRSATVSLTQFSYSHGPRLKVPSFVF
jgi:hypothetical protein